MLWLLSTDSFLTWLNRSIPPSMVLDLVKSLSILPVNSTSSSSSSSSKSKLKVDIASKLVLFASDSFTPVLSSSFSLSTLSSLLNPSEATLPSESMDNKSSNACDKSKSFNASVSVAAL